MGARAATAAGVAAGAAGFAQNGTIALLANSAIFLYFSHNFSLAF
jgi:hypothetical protein